MSDMIVLYEHLTPKEANIITESTIESGNKTLWLNGVFMMAEGKNRNGRIYKVDELTEAVKNANETIKQTNGMLGELDHPADRLSTQLDRVSHVIKELWMDGNNACGRAQILDTPMGLIAQKIIEAKVVLGVSSRGSGQVSESGYVSHFNLNTIDIVTTPSAPNAYPQAIRESIEQAKNGNQILTLAEAAKHDPAAQKYMTNEIMKFLNELNPKKRS